MTLCAKLVDFYFTSQIQNIKQTIDFLAGDRMWIPRADYPDFLYWLDKVEVELEEGQKRCIQAYSQKHLVGTIIFQQHKQFKDILELKNLTVSGEAAGRYVASFLIKNAEVEGRNNFGSSGVLGDAKRTNFAITELMTKHGYNVSTSIDLYHLGKEKDNIFFKQFKK